MIKLEENVSDEQEHVNVTSRNGSSRKTPVQTVNESSVATEEGGQNRQNNTISRNTNSSARTAGNNARVNNSGAVAVNTAQLPGSGPSSATDSLKIIGHFYKQAH